MNSSTNGARVEGEPEMDFNDLFSLRKPKDARAGFSSGVKSVAKGVVAGAVGLVAAPVIGAHQEGVKGFAKGAAAGIAGAVLLPVTGVAIGATQIVRGIANTPEAVREQASGKQWDTGMRSWVDQPSTALSLNTAPQPQPWQIPSAIAASSGGEVDYYALLGVSQAATPEEIKKAYFMLARKMHPDKNPDDPEANEKFQRLGEAYQVLGNPELRQRYDSHGKDGLDVNFVDGAEFFTALFGSEQFNHLVGELMIAAAARSGQNLDAQQLKRMQEEREQELTLMLTAILLMWQEGDEKGFIEAMTAQATGLANASYGEVMLHAIGRVYRVQATIYLGNLVDSSIASLKAKGRSIKSQFQAASAAIKVYQAQQQMTKLEVQAERAKVQADDAAKDATAEANGTSATTTTTSAASLTAATATAQQQPQQFSVEELRHIAAAANAERAKLEEQSLPLMLDAMWAANILDIESTVRHVCRRVLNDASATKEQRKRRAQGLLELGNIFYNAKQTGDTTPKDAKAAMEAAMMQVMEKKMQADDAQYGGSGA